MRFRENQADIQFGFAVILQIEVQGIWITWIAAMYNNQVPLRENVTRWRCRSGVRFHFELFNVQAFNSPSPRNTLIQRMRPLLFQCAHLGIGFILNEFAESVEEVRYGGIHLLEAHFFPPGPLKVYDLRIDVARVVQANMLWNSTAAT